MKEDGMMRRLAWTAVLAVALLAGGRAAAEEKFVNFRVMTVEVALELAQATLKHCRAQGWQASVAVVDRFGVVQVVLRDRFAGPHTPNTAISKAWTAISFRSSTTELAANSQPGQPSSGIRHIPGAIMVGGGLPVESRGSMVGGVGVSGAPGGEADDACARAGIAAIEEKLAFD
jgi:uncharacterized protein GlcG (DUF336 family)